MDTVRSNFTNRTQAGRELAAELRKREWRDPVVLALPRGGVPVAFEVAQALKAPLDLAMVRKIGAPGNSEYAIGALVDGNSPVIVLDQQAVSRTGATEEYIELSKQAALKEIERRRVAYGAAQPIPLKGRTAILVDDGIATGSTAKAALKAIRKASPETVVLAVPVAPLDAITRLSPLCDEIVCLATPAEFYSVGEHYDEFDQTSDADVIRCINEARKQAQP